MNLSDKGRLRLAVRLAFVAGIGLAGSVQAQTASKPNCESGDGDKSCNSTKLQAVQVTGSRIKAPNLTSTAPVATVTAKEVAETGTTRVEDLLNRLPQVFADQGGNISNGATGTATVNLRNLGASRTLVLVDGKRLMPGDPTSSAADLNFIPAAMIESIDVQTGGASAVYGADAVAGVVNVKMKKDFEGFRIDYQNSFYWHDQHNKTVTPALKTFQARGASGYDSPGDTTVDGRGNNVALTWGVNSADGKGNATLYATFLNLDPITQSKRDFSACTVGNSGKSAFACTGSSTSYPGRFLPLDEDGNIVGSYTIDPATKAFVPYTSANSFNFGPYNYYQRNAERYTLGGFAHYDFNEHAQVYSQLMFMDDRTNAVIAPSGSFLQEFAISCSNPLLSSSQVETLCTDQGYGAGDSVNMLIGRRNVEGGGRDDDLRHTAYRIVAGVKGEIIDGFSYDTYAQYGQTQLTEVYRNDFSVTRLGRALDVVDDGSGNVVCRSVVDGTDPNCVPWNIWSAAAVSGASLDYLQTPGLLQGSAAEQIVSGSVSGSLGQYGLKSPYAKEGVGLVVGSEYRRVRGFFDTDNAFSTGDLAGQGGATIGTGGSFDVKEFFSEALIPIASGLPFVYNAWLEGGYRHSKYSSAGDTNTYKIGAQFAPVKDVTLRASYNRAVRAPNIGELTAPVRVGLSGNTDPCASASPSASLSECLNDPVIAANPSLYGNILENPAGQYNGLLGSSPGLRTETAFSTTLGAVFQPTFIKGFTASIDYFDIKVKGLIGGYGADTILDTCYTAGTLCNLIKRDSNTGSLWLNDSGYVINQTTNTGALVTRGIDFTSSYRLKLDDVGLKNAGSMFFELVASHMLQQNTQPIPNGSSYKCEGLYGLQCGTPVPRYRHKLRATWNAPAQWYGASVTAAWRLMGGVSADQLSSPNDLDRHLAAQHYLDMVGSIRVFDHYTLRAGMNNVFDNDPPIVGSGSLPSVYGNGNTFPQVYDALGRYVFMGVSAEF